MQKKRFVAVWVLVCMICSLVTTVPVSAALSNEMFDETGKTYTATNYGVLGSGATKTISFVFGSQTGALAKDTGIVISELSNTSVNRTSPLNGAYLKGNAILTDGTEVFIDVPIYGVRRNNAGTLLCVEVLLSDLPANAPKVSEGYKATATEYTFYSKFIPMEIYDFPEGTLFISMSQLSDEPGNWSEESYDGYPYYFKGQNGSGDGPYAHLKAQNAGSYRVWALCKKQNDNVSRKGVVLIDGKTAVFDAQVTESKMDFRWEKDSADNVILLKRNEKFMVRQTKDSSAWGRIAALALVPATEDLTDTALSQNVIYDTKYQFSMDEMFSNQNDAFSIVEKEEHADVEVTVNGVAHTVKTNSAVLLGADVAENDSNGVKINYPTVADAILGAGAVKASDFISGYPKKVRVTVDGKIVSACDVEELLGGEEISVIAIDNTNFNPVNYGSLQPAEGTYAGLLKMSPNIQSMLATELSFAVGENGKLITGAAGLKGCYLNGYVETNSKITGVTSDGVSYSIPKGSKVYFCNVEILSCVNPSSGKPGLIPNPTAVSTHQYTSDKGYGDSVIKLDDGSYIPNPFSFVYGADYNTGNLYITNKNTGNEFNVTEYDGKYLITADSYKFVNVVRATYSDDNRLLDFEQIGEFVSAGAPLLVELNKNQKAFIWDNSVTLGDKSGVSAEGGTKMIPLSDVMEYNSGSEEASSTEFPIYAKQLFDETETATIENGSNKVIFYQGNTEEGISVVQTEIYTKNSSDEWVKTKSREEEAGFLMMNADDAEYLNGSDGGMNISIKNNIGNAVFTKGTSDFFEMGRGTWLIPSRFEVISDTEVKLYFENQNKVVFTAVYKFDDLAEDIKVTIDAKFKEKGAYSFMFFNGDGVEYEEFDTVTAPFLYIKHAVPDNAVLINEPLLFTPMNTLHFPKNGVKAGGEEVTIGVAVDPSSVEQGYPLMRTSKFAAMLRTSDGLVRSHIVAPVMGNPASKFKAGDSYTFSVRLLNRTEGWYDTFKHVAQDLFNCTDLRTNYYGSVNDTIYNVSDLMMDDLGGWDNEWMGWYNMEAKNCVSQSNFLSAYQNYLITDDESIAEERVVPTIAYMLSRGKAHYLPSDDVTTVNYGNPNTPLTRPVGQVGTVYGGVYEMSQGRMPYLLDYLITKGGSDVFDYIALYKYTKDEKYKTQVINAADKYLNTYPNSETGRESRLVNGFVYGDYIKMVTTLLAAYEVTGEQEYLDKAEECGRLLMAVVWTTDYQNDYAEKDFYVDPIKEAERGTHFDKANYNFWWHGDEKFRPGSPIGTVKSIVKLTESGSAILDAETVPGWLLAKAGFGTEHASTPGNNNVITMNNWLGAMVRLSEYTGDSFFETQARNSIIGRYQNYPGYYLDRTSTQYYKADYPYVGPDISGIYWHHIPIFSAMVQDFLINEAWAKTNRNFDFPYIYQRGYAYFDSYQFGHAPGRVYNEKDMWLWLDRGVVTPDNINIDYVVARKDGVLAMVLMNEDNKEVTTSVTLGNVVGTVNGVTARVIDGGGNASTTSVNGNKFTLSIPSKQAKTVIISGLSSVKAPSYAEKYTYSNQVYNTMTAHKNGNGYVIQVNDDSYYAYVFITDQNSTVPKATLTYTVGGVTKSVTDEKLNHEWLIKVDDTTKAFTYTIEVEDSAGNTENYGGGLLEPLSKTAADGKASYMGIDLNLRSSPVYFDKKPTVENSLAFAPLKLEISSHGTSGNNFRLVCNNEAQFSSIVGNNFEKLTGLKLEGTFTSAQTGASVKVEGYVDGITRTNSGSLVLLLPKPDNLSINLYGNNGKGTFDLTLYPQK